MLSTSPYVIQLNTSKPPFDDQKARDAVYYATDTEAIRKGLFNNRYPTSQTFTGPGGLFCKPTVPGYKTFDLAKAKQLVSEMGGMQALGTINVLVAKQTTRPCRANGRRPGSRRRSSPTTSAGSSRRSADKWQSMLQTAGAWDPATAWASGSGSTRTRRSRA